MEPSAEHRLLPRLQVKGALREGALYIERTADDELERALLDGQYCYVLAPRQIGKSSLRLHIARKLAGVRCVHVDLTLVGGYDDAEPRRGWYFSLISLIAAQLEIGDPQPFWERRGDALPVFHFGRYLREQVLAQIAAPVVVFIDEIDYLRSLPFDTDEFIDAIRAYCNARADDPAYRRLTFCLMGVVAPADLIRNAQITPFNIGQEVAVEDFSRRELDGFLPLLESLGGEAATWLDEVYRWTSGHPYMTQLLCDRLRSQQSGEAQGDVRQRVERVVSTLFLQRGRTVDPNLSYAETRLDSQRDQLRKADLLSLYRRLLQEGSVPLREADPVQFELRLCGLAAKGEAIYGARYLFPRNEVFTRVFNLTWVREKETQRHLSHALRHWQEGGRRPESLLRGAELETAQQWATEHAGEITREENEFLRASLDGARRHAEEQRLASDARNQQERLASETRSQWRALLGLTVALVLLLALAIELGLQFRRAEFSARNEAALARSETKLREDAENATRKAVQAAEAERQATWTAQQETKRAELATAEARTQQKEAVTAAKRERTARTAAEQEKRRAEQERARANFEAKHAQKEAERTNSALRIEKSLRAAAIATQPGSQIQALLAGMQAAEPERKAGLGPQWEGANRAAEESTLSIVLNTPHSGPVMAAAFSSDGQRVVTASVDGNARLWNARDGRLLFMFHGHSNAVLSAAISPDGRWVATASSDRTARLWDAKDGRLLLVLSGHSAAVQSVAFSPDGRRVVTASTDRTARLWDAKSGQLLLTLLGHSDWVRAAAFSPDGKQVVTASNDRTARLWDTKTGRLLYVLAGHSGSVLSAAVSLDGQWVLTASEDRTARLWNAKDGGLLFALHGHSDSVLSAAFSVDGRQFVTASADHTARLWDARDGRSLAILNGHSGPVQSAALSPDGKHVVTASTDGTARLWNAKDGRIFRPLQGHAGAVRAVAFSPNGQRVVTASEDGTARLWDFKDGQLLLILQEQGPTNAVRTANFSPNGQQIVTAGDDFKARLWDARNGSRLLSLSGHSASVLSATFSPDGQWIVTASEDSTVRMWNAQTGDCFHILVGHTNAVQSAAFSPDGQVIVTASDDNTARMWDAQTGNHLRTIDDYRVHSAAFSPDGQQIVTASDDRTARLWNAKDGKWLRSLDGHSGWVLRAVFSPDGKRILTASADHTARLWDAADGRLLLTLQGHFERIQSAAFSPDGQYVVTAGWDGMALIHPINPEAIYAFDCKLLRSLSSPDEQARGADTILATCPPKE